MFKAIYRALIVVGVLTASAFAQQTYVTAIIPDSVQNWAPTNSGAQFYVGAAGATGCPISTTTITSDRAGATTITQTSGVTVPAGAKTVSFYIAPGTYTLEWKVPSGAGSQCSTTPFTAAGDTSLLTTANLNIVDGTDNTKKIVFSASGATTGTTATIADALAASRTLTIADPGGAGTFAYTNSTTVPQVMSGTQSFTGNRAVLTAPFTDGNGTTNLQAITGLVSPTYPTTFTGTVFFACDLEFSQATQVSDQIGIQVTTTAPTRADASGMEFTSATATHTGTGVSNLTTTTATAIDTFTPSVATGLVGHYFGQVTFAGGGNAAIQLMASQATAADVIIFAAGSACTFW